VKCGVTAWKDNNASARARGSDYLSTLDMRPGEQMTLRRETMRVLPFGRQELDRKGHEKYIKGTGARRVVEGGGWRVGCSWRTSQFQFPFPNVEKGRAWRAWRARLNPTATARCLPVNTRQAC